MTDRPSQEPRFYHRPDNEEAIRERDASPCVRPPTYSPAKGWPDSPAIAVVDRRTLLALLDEARTPSLGPPAALDVERLAESIAAAGFEAHSADIVAFAREVADEYARLTEQEEGE